MTATTRTDQSTDPGRNPGIERRRDSAATQSGSTERRPRMGLPAGSRRYGQWAATVLFVLVMVLAAGWLWQHKSDRVEVLQARRDVPAGTVLSRGDFTTAEVAGADAAIPLTDLDQVTGKTTALGLVRGQLLTADMVTSQQVPGSGQRLIGLQLDATRAPEGLEPGDVVAVLEAPPAGDPGNVGDLAAARVLATRARVQHVSRVQGGGTRVAVLVPVGTANEVAEFGSANRVTLVQGPVGGDG